MFFEKTESFLRIIFFLPMFRDHFSEWNQTVFFHHVYRDAGLQIIMWIFFTRTCSITQMPKPIHCKVFRCSRMFVTHGGIGKTLVTALVFQRTRVHWARGRIRTCVGFPLLITNQVQSTAMRLGPVWRNYFRFSQKKSTVDRDGNAPTFSDFQSDT